MGKTNSELDQRNTKILVQKSKTPWRKCHKNSIHPQLAAPTLLPCQLWPAGVSLSLSLSSTCHCFPGPVCKSGSETPPCPSALNRGGPKSTILFFLWCLCDRPTRSGVSIGTCEWTGCPKTCCGLETCQFVKAHERKCTEIWSSPKPPPSISSYLSLSVELQHVFEDSIWTLSDSCIVLE